MKIMWRITIIIFAALAGCALEAPPPEVEARALAIQEDDPSAEEAAVEAVRLYQELTARLEARGVTIEEMQAAVDAGDAERVRELFGFTPEEYEAMNSRVLALANKLRNASIEDSSVGVVHPEGLDCRGVLTCGITVMSIAWFQPQIAGAILVAGYFVCAIDNCRWDDDPRARTKKK